MAVREVVHASETNAVAWHTKDVDGVSGVRGLDHTELSACCRNRGLLLQQVER